VSEKGDILFEFLNDITFKKRNILTDENKKSYYAFMINRFLSGYLDCVYLANEMNQRYALDTRLQYDFYLHSIRKSKRFAPYIKPEKLEDLDLISRYYDCSKSKAKEFLGFHTEENLKQIREHFETGGVLKKTKKTKKSK